MSSILTSRQPRRRRETAEEETAEEGTLEEEIMDLEVKLRRNPSCKALGKPHTFEGMPDGKGKTYYRCTTCGRGRGHY